jgi:hypothetical protein
MGTNVEGVRTSQDVILDKKSLMANRASEDMIQKFAVKLPFKAGVSPFSFQL